MKNDVQVTICIPTLNRPGFLFRLLKYCADVRFKQCFFIGDSSYGKCLQENKKAVRQFENELNIRHFECPDMDVVEALDSFNHLITTPYAAICCDDDFLCPHGLNLCAKFLDVHPKYSAAHGIGVILGLDRKGPFGKVSSLNELRQCTVEQETGIGRLTSLYSDQTHALVYSVHRVSDWCDMWKTFQGSRPGFLFEELYPDTISCIRGKVKELDVLYLVRHGHGDNVKQDQFYRWITNHDWFVNYDILKASAVKELIKIDKVSSEMAEKEFDTAFCFYITRMATHAYTSYLSSEQDLKTEESLAKRCLKQFKQKVFQKKPDWEETYILFRNRVLNWKRKTDGINLHEVLKDSSPYHNDFMPIYKIITSPPSNH